MAIFFSIIKQENKSETLKNICDDFRQNKFNSLNYELSMHYFDNLPGKPFSYWLSEQFLNNFKNHKNFKNLGRYTRGGLQTNDNFRFLRLFWEIKNYDKWFFHAKGGPYSKFYSNLPIVINWSKNGKENKAFNTIKNNYKHWSRYIVSEELYFKQGFTWSEAATSNVSFRILPKGCLFDKTGPFGFHKSMNKHEIFSSIALLNSIAFSYFLNTMLGSTPEGRKHYTSGSINKTPFPALSDLQISELSKLSEEGWSIKYTIDSINETSLAFILPLNIREKIDDFNLVSLKHKLKKVEDKINEIGFKLYNFNEDDKIKAIDQYNRTAISENFDEGVGNTKLLYLEKVLSWAVGVVFGRFEIKLATGEKKLPENPDPFEKLNYFGAAMISDEKSSFENKLHIAVEDPLHPNDLSNLVQKVLDDIDYNIDIDIRKWISTKFFDFHLKMYSQSKRRSPIYWPLSSPNGLYKIWIYYPLMTDQTLYAAVNQYVDPKITYVQQKLNQLQNKSTNRTSSDEIQLEKYSNFEQDLIIFRDKLLKKAHIYKPHHDDGVEVTASPLVDFFKHNSWNKALKSTWTKIERGDYDWSYTAMDNWPERVREKCKKDKSLAIAHNLENIYNKGKT